MRLSLKRGEKREIPPSATVLLDATANQLQGWPQLSLGKLINKMVKLVTHRAHASSVRTALDVTRDRACGPASPLCWRSLPVACLKQHPARGTSASSLTCLPRSRRQKRMRTITGWGRDSDRCCAVIGFAGRILCGPVLSQPDDLAEGSIGGVLRAGWGFMATSVEYQAVGFGSHHWLATDARGARLFVTVDDLSAKRRTLSDTTDAAFDRLTRAFSAAMSLRAESLLRTYAAATGADIDQDALSLYRLWYDLAEIGGYLSHFRKPHRQTADTAESWKNLRHFLQPAERWPALYEPGVPSPTSALATRIESQTFADRGRCGHAGLLDDRDQ